MCTGFFSLAIIKGLLMIIIFYHRRPSKTLFTEKVSHSLLGTISVKELSGSVKTLMLMAFK
ncbi:hypothetical protein [[Ruminococcus] torques]|uniref:hypothetical protein n=1 Tax=[Ruminococcus] torques TaxID=33039 RepID=UPI003AB7B28C